MLSVATLEWLSERGLLRPTTASPFGFLASGPRQTSREERTAAARRELGATPDPVLMRAIEITSRPEGKIRLSTASTARPARQITLLRRGDALSQCGFNREGFLLGRPLEIEALVARLVADLSSEPPSASTTDHLLSPRALDLLSILWPGNGLSGSSPLPRATALAACRQVAAEEAAAQPLMDDLVESGLVQDKGDTFLLDPEWRPWFERLWSRDLYEIEVTPLPAADFDLARLLEQRERLLFIGPEGQRIACRAVQGGSLEEMMPGSRRQEGYEEHLVALSHLDDEMLADLLRGLLWLDDRGFLRKPANASASSGTPTTDAASRR